MSAELQDVGRSPTQELTWQRGVGGAVSPASSQSTHVLQKRARAGEKLLECWLEVSTGNLTRVLARGANISTFLGIELVEVRLWFTSPGPMPMAPADRRGRGLADCSDGAAKFNRTKCASDEILICKSAVSGRLELDLVAVHIPWRCLQTEEQEG